MLFIIYQSVHTETLFQAVMFIYTIRNMLKVSFIISCQHFPQNVFFNFLVHQFCKLNQRCCLKITWSRLSQLFKTAIEVWVALKFAVAETQESWPSGCTFTITLEIKKKITKNVPFSLILYIKWVRKEILLNFQKVVIFIRKCVFAHPRKEKKKKKSKICFSASCSLFILQLHAGTD